MFPSAARYSVFVVHPQGTRHWSSPSGGTPIGGSDSITTYGEVFGPIDLGGGWCRTAQVLRMESTARQILRYMVAGAVAARFLPLRIRVCNNMQALRCHIRYPGHTGEIDVLATAEVVPGKRVQRRCVFSETTSASRPSNVVVFVAGTE